jgi:hypothetical protein
MRAFVHNWASEVLVESTWDTTRTEAHDSLAEERILNAGRPNRAVTFRWTSIDRAEAQRMLWALQRAAADDFHGVPLYPDEAVTTASSSGTTINCPTTDRRFAVGNDVVIVALDHDGRVESYEVATIDALGPSTITTDGALGATYPAGSVVFPLLYSEEVLEARMDFAAPGVANVTLTITSQVWPGYGPETTSTPGVNPSGWSTQGGLPILSAAPEWGAHVGVDLERPAEVYRTGKYNWVAPRGERARRRVTFQVLTSTRDEAMDVIEFFDSRGGRVGSFWLILPPGLLRVTGITTTYVDVEADAESISDLQDLMPYVGLVLTDGTHLVRTVSSVSLVAGKFRVAFSSAIPATDLEDVESASPALLARFDKDVLVEAWITSETCRLRLDVVELLAEQTAAVG